MEIKLIPSVCWRFALFLFPQSAACSVFSVFSLSSWRSAKLLSTFVCDACILLSCDNIGDRHDMSALGRMVFKRKNKNSIRRKLAVFGRNGAEGFYWCQRLWRTGSEGSCAAHPLMLKLIPLVRGTFLSKGAVQGPVTSPCTLCASAPASPAPAECRRKKSGLLLNYLNFKVRRAWPHWRCGAVPAVWCGAVRRGRCGAMPCGAGQAELLCAVPPVQCGAVPAVGCGAAPLVGCGAVGCGAMRWDVG